MKVKPINKLKLRKVTTGQYLTDDNLYLIAKDNKGWFWQVSEDAQWVSKDRRRYKTKRWVEKCVEEEKYQNDNEIKLWKE